MSNSFNFDEALKDLQVGKDLTGKDGILMPLIKQLTEAAITAELDHHLANNDEARRYTVPIGQNGIRKTKSQNLTGYVS
jgi:putative transposase